MSSGSSSSCGDPSSWISQLRQCKYLPEKEIKSLCDAVRNILIEESNIQPVQSPITVCGDIHGQFWDLLELLRVGGEPPETGYVFMVSGVKWSFQKDQGQDAMVDSARSSQSQKDPRWNRFSLEEFDSTLTFYKLLEIHSMLSKLLL